MSNSPPRPISKTPHLPPSSPKRQPLHQRSESQANSSAPTIRFVTDSSSDVYGKSPFPTHPSQILYPRYAPALDQDVRNVRVSRSDENANYASTKPIKHEALVPSPLRTRKSNRTSTSTTTSDVDTSFDTYGSALSPTSSRFSSRTSPPTSLFADEDRDRTSSRLTPVLEQITSRQPTPSTSRSTIRPVIPSASNVRVQDVVKQLETTLATSSQSDRPISSASSRRLSRPVSSTSSNNYVVFPNSSQASLPKTGSANQSDDTLQSLPALKLRHKPKGLSSPPRAQSPPKTPKNVTKQHSHESLAFSDASYSTNVERPRSASSPASPAHAVRAAILTGAKLQYSIVRAPSASGSWAEVSRPTTTNPPRMNDGSSRQPVWSSRLSTIASESTRTTQSNSSSGFGYQPRRRTIGSVASDGAQTSEGVSSEFEYGSGVLTGTESNVSIPPPLFSPATVNRPLPPTPGHAPAGRDSDEREDTLGELQAHPLRHQRSFLSRFSSTSRPGSAESGMSSRSQLSFMGDLSWARRYYSGEQTNFARSGLDVSTDSGGSIRLDTATSGNTSSPTSDTFPNTVWRPRTRPHERPRNERLPRPSRTRDSAITEVSEVESVPVTGRSRATSLSVNEMMYSPHLRRDRRTANTYSAWAAPSFEEPFVRSLFGPTGRQLLLFVLGFIMPPCKS
jgi:hypothetical protein